MLLHRCMHVEYTDVGSSAISNMKYYLPCGHVWIGYVELMGTSYNAYFPLNSCIYVMRLAGTSN